MSGIEWGSIVRAFHSVLQATFPAETTTGCQVSLGMPSIPVCPCFMDFH